MIYFGARKYSASDTVESSPPTVKQANLDFKSYCTLSKCLEV